MNDRIRKLALAAGLAVLVFEAGCASSRAHREGLDAFDRGDYEVAVSKLSEALRAEPSNLAYRLDLRSRTETAVQQLIAAGDAARSGGKPELAETAYHRVLVIEPGNERARRGLAALEADRVHAKQIVAAQKLLDAKQLDAADAEVRSVLTEDPGFAPATQLAARIDQARGPATAVPRLKTRDNRPVSLSFRDAQTKMVFEVLARQTGLNFIFDKDVKSDGKTTIFVSQVPVEQAIDLILAQNQLARQVLSDTMVLIYPSTAAKQKDYQDEIVRTFYLQSAAPKDAETMLKTVLGAKTLFVDERTSSLVMRDTPEHVRMAEKLIASLDVAEPEVVMEVEVLEITRTLLDQLGINYPSNVAFAMTKPANSSGTGTGLVVSDLHKQDSGTITVSPLSVSVDLLKQTTHSNVLSSPRIRAKNREKAKILIGDRVPVVTTGASATTGGTYATSNVQYIEVGLTLDVQPTIHLDGNVSIKVGLEVSSIIKQINVPTGAGGNTLAYQIGTRNASTTLELKDGETQVLAGLIQDNEQKSSSHIPGLGDLPVLGHLFGSKGTNATKNEIVLSITPRIIRSQARPSSESLEFWYGSESQLRTAPLTSSAPTPAAGPATGGGPVGPGSVSFAGSSSPSGVAAPITTRTLPSRIDAGAAAPAPVAPAAVPAPAPPAGDAAAPAEGASAGAAPPPAAPDAATASAPAAPRGKPRVTLEGPDAAKVGEEFAVAVRLSDGDGLGRVRAQVRFDASALQLVSASAGDLAADDPRVDVRPGGAQLDLTSVAPNATSGSVMTLKFRAVAPRPVSIVTQVIAMAQDGTALASTPATPLKVSLTP